MLPIFTKLIVDNFLKIIAFVAAYAAHHDAMHIVTWCVRAIMHGWQRKHIENTKN